MNKSSLKFVFFLSGVATLICAFLSSEWFLKIATFKQSLDYNVMLRIPVSRNLFFGFSVASFALSFLCSKLPAVKGWLDKTISISWLTCTLLIILELFLALKYSAYYKIADPFYERKMPIALNDACGHILNSDLDHSYKINSNSFRGKELPPDVKNRKVIINMGNSNVFGWNIFDEDSTGSALLEKSVQKYGFMVINGGVPRYTSKNILCVLNSRIINYKPDIITLCVGWNDLLYAYRFKDNWTPDYCMKGAHTEWDQPEFSPAILRFTRLMSSKYKVGDASSTVNITEAKKDSLNDYFPPAALGEYRKNIESIIAFCAENNIKLLILNMPTLMNDNMNEREIALSSFFLNKPIYSKFNNTLLETAKAHNVECVDDIFSFDQKNKDRYLIDYCHPNGKGNIIVADKIFLKLKQLGWLDK